MAFNKCVALVTGGAQGFGRAFAERLLKEGAKVAALDINSKVGKQFESEMKDIYGENCLKFLQCDVSKQDDLFRSFDEVKAKFGSLDIVCNNAGVIMEKPEDARKVIAINLTAVIEGTFKGIELMSKKNGGNGGLIVNVSSAAGLELMAGAPIYTASKMGVTSFTRSFKLLPTLKEDGVRVNCICPFITDTDMSRNARSDYRKDIVEFYEAMGMADINDVVGAFMRCVNEKEMNANAVAIYPNHQVFDVYFPHNQPKSNKSKL